MLIECQLHMLVLRIADRNLWTLNVHLSLTACLDGVWECRHIVDCLGGAEEVAAIPLTHIEHPRPGLRHYQPSSMAEQHVCGDVVPCFDEISAACGCLGRFPGSQVMPLLCQFLR